MQRLSDSPPEFPWGAYDRWLTTTPADRGHVEECNCIECHDAHQEFLDYDVVEYAKECRYCFEWLEEKYESGEWCRIHGWEYIMPGEKVCGKCEEIKYHRPVA